MSSASCTSGGPRPAHCSLQVGDCAPPPRRQSRGPLRPLEPDRAQAFLRPSPRATACAGWWRARRGARLRCLGGGAIGPRVSGPHRAAKRRSAYLSLSAPRCSPATAPRLSAPPIRVQPRGACAAAPVAGTAGSVIVPRSASQACAQKRSAAFSLTSFAPSPASLACRVASSPSTASGPSCQRVPVRTVRFPASPNVIPA